MEKTDLRESKKEIPVYRVSSKATKLFLKVIKATSIKPELMLWSLRTPSCSDVQGLFPCTFSPLSAQTQWVYVGFTDWAVQLK